MSSQPELSRLASVHIMPSYTLGARLFSWRVIVFKITNYGIHNLWKTGPPTRSGWTCNEVELVETQMVFNDRMVHAVDNLESTRLGSET